MVAGIIVTAAADEKVLAHPSATPDTATALMILGGTGLFLAGHAAFKATVWRVIPWTRLLAIGLFCLLGFIASHVSALILGACAGVVLIALAASDHLLARAPGPSTRALS